MKYKTCSVIVCVYKNDNPEFFKQAINSVLNQTLKSNDIIIVVDGPVGAELKKTIKKFEKLKNITVKWLPKNVGTGQASNVGIGLTKNELIAKLDADDIAYTDRFEKQTAMFNKEKKLAYLGGQMKEFLGDKKNIVSERYVPTDYEQIKKFARRRCPFNNSTVMYKKSAITSVDGYPTETRSEDYFLVAKLLAAGYVIKNLPDYLAYYRLSNDVYARRKTWKHTKATIIMRWKIRKLGVSRIQDALLITIVQLVMFILPSGFTKLVYRTIQK